MKKKEVKKIVDEIFEKYRGANADTLTGAMIRVEKASEAEDGNVECLTYMIEAVAICARAIELEKENV